MNSFTAGLNTISMIRKLLFACWLLFLFLPNTNAQTVSQRDLEKAFDYYESQIRKFEFTNPDSLGHYTLQGLAYFSKHQYGRGKVRMLVAQASLAGRRGEIELGRKRVTEALKICREEGDKHGEAQVLNISGVLYGRTGNFDSATSCFLSALRHYESTNNKKGIITSLINLGTASEMAHNLDRALEYYDRAIALAETIKNNVDLPGLYNNRGVVLCQKGEFEASIPVFQKAASLSEAQNLTSVTALTYTNQGNLYKELNKPKIALDYYERALKITPESMAEDRVRLYLNKANLEGETNPKRALALLEQCLPTARKIGHLKLESEILLAMADIEAEQKNFAAAYQHQVALQEVLDSLFEARKISELNKLQSKYDLEEHEKEVDWLSKQNKMLTQAQVAMVVIMVALTLMLIALYRLYSKNRLLLENVRTKEADLLKANTEKDKFFSIIGHDLKGPVSSIPALINILLDPNTTEDEKEYILSSILESTTAATEILDRLLHWGKNHIKGIDKGKSSFRPAEFVDLNLSLLRTGLATKAITAKNHIAADMLAYANPDNISFVIRNLLANAIKFTNQGGTIDISAYEHTDPDYLTILVRDNGVGMSEEQLSKIFELSNISHLGTAHEKGNSMGLILSKEFIEQNNGTIWVESELGKGSSFYFTIPLPPLAERTMAPHAEGEAH